MKRTVIGILVLSCLFIPVMALAQMSEGTIVFTKSEFTRDGFREFILKEIFSERIWWTFYRRNICVINPDGTGFRQLTDDDTSYRPRWSPDGREIAFCSGTPPRVSLHVIKPDGTDRVAVVKWQSNIYDFRWSPDGTKIMVYVETKSPRDPEETWVVTVSEEVSTERIGRSEWARGWHHWASEGATLVKPNRRLLDALPEETEWPEWSPDTRYLAFVYSNKLALADTTVVGMPDKWRPGQFDPPCDQLIDWSHDGSKFLFLGGGYVSSINIDGTGLTNLNMSKSTDACWSPDGTHIAYTAAGGHKENTEIYIMKADGTDHLQLTNTNYFHMDLDWR
jgi:TolB protein